MPKAKRGKLIKATPGWRGTCPVCKRTGVKLLWNRNDEDGKAMNVCKHCGKQTKFKRPLRETFVL